MHISTLRGLCDTFECTTASIRGGQEAGFTHLLRDKLSQLSANSVVTVVSLGDLERRKIVAVSEYIPTALSVRGLLPDTAAQTSQSTQL